MMTSSETLFNPRDNSLAERVRMYASLCRDFNRVQASVKFIKKRENTNFVGDEQEVASAYEVIASSLAQASKSVNDAELKQAQEQGLLGKDDLTEIVKLQRLNEKARQREEKVDSTSSKFSKQN